MNTNLKNTRLKVKKNSMQAGNGSLRDKILAGLPVKERRIQVAGISTAFLEGGDGPPMVLLHGQGEFAAVWTRVLPELAKSYRIIVPDLPGHGATETGDGTLDIERVVGWLNELIDNTCSSQPVLAGHLLGGGIALHYALTYSTKVQQLVLVDSLGLARYRPELRFALAMAGFVIHPSDRSRDRLFRQCMLDLDDVREQMDGRFRLLESYALDRAKTPKLKKALQKLMPVFALNAISQEELATISIPVSLIWGRHDRQVRLQIARDASEKYGWPLHIIEKAADDPAVEQPEEFLRAFHTITVNHSRRR